MESGGGAYGGPPASSSRINPLKIITKPQFILRIVSFIFSIIVIGCLASTPKKEDASYACGFLIEKVSSCHLGVAVAVIALIASIVFLVLDVIFDTLSNVNTRKILVIGDLAFSGLWTFMWFVSFCFLTQRIRVSIVPFPKGKAHARGGDAFTFFSIIVWSALTVLALLRFRQGAQSAFSRNYEPDPGAPPPAEATGGDSYQQPPFVQKTETPETQYQAPTY